MRPPFPREGRTAQKGVALVFVLCMLALLMAVIVVFFARTQLDLQIAFSSTNTLKADLLARSTLDIVTGEIRNEIQDPANSTVSNGGSTSYPLLYTPKTTANAVPAFLGVVSPTGALIRVSAADTPIRPNGTIRASSFSTATASQNGRYLLAGRWFTSAAGSPRLGAQSAAPTWLFVTRANGVKTPVLADARDPVSGDYVIGRFAYAIYDTGGLLDANVAGYPTAAAGDAGGKTSAAYADLTALGMTAADLQGFVGWRNAQTGIDAATFRQWATGLVPAGGSASGPALAAARSGHLSVASGDNAVLSRHDLLNNVRLAGSAGLLTHFARTASAPVWRPSDPTLADVRWTNGGTVLHYNDDGTTLAVTVAAGDPVLQHRFSLAKLAWIGADGPNAAAFAATLSAQNRKDAIRACFGLEWNPGTARWDYKDNDASYAINTLDKLAGGTREPNLFELLKAGIAVGSLGKKSDLKTMSSTDQQDRDGSADLQILRIGADMIDCADSDNFPTTLTLNFGGTLVPVHGVEDLPYLDRLDFSQVSMTKYVSASTASLQWATMFMLPELFNPHRAGMTSNTGPAQIKVSIESGLVLQVYNGAIGARPTDPLVRLALNRDLSLCPPITIPGSAFEDFRATVKTPRGTEATSATTLGSLLASPATIDASMSDLHGFTYYPYQRLPENYDNTRGVTLRSFVSNLLVVMRFQDAAGNWRIYDTLTGSEAFPSSTGIVPAETADSKEAWDFLPMITAGITADQSFTKPDTMQGVMKLDPRTTRFSISRGAGFGSRSDNYTTYPPGSARGVRYNLPFGAGSAPSGTLLFPELWAQGGKSGWNDPTLSTTNNVADNDGTVRPADGWLGDAANPYRSLGDASRRPVVLQRPFRSVGELGYVFRDSPWKTLNLFDATSGDGPLLDLFIVADEPAVTAGRSGLDGNQPLSSQALLAGTGQAPDGTAPLPGPAAIATAFNNYALSAGTPTANMPLSLAGLTSFMSSSNLTTAYSTTTTPLKAQREAVVRSLAGSTQTRTWNLLIDVVAQCGRYAPGAASLNSFIVEGEKRYWLSVAVDRYTGKIISRQLEPVNE